MMRVLSGLKIWRIFFAALILVLLQTGLAFAQPIRVIASWPALADIARQVGKDLVNVESLATGVERTLTAFR